MGRFVTPAAVLALAVAAPAQADSTRMWTVTSAQARISGPWRALSETIIRTSARPGAIDVEQGTSLGYRFDRTFTAWIGYVYSPVHIPGAGLVREHRLRQQVNVARIAMIGPVRLSGRLRLETRWREGVTGTAWRLRPQVHASLPLSGRLALNLSNETFLNLDNTRFQRAGVDRTRASLTLSLPVAKSFSIDAGYLNQHVFVPTGPDTVDHVALIVVSRAF